MAKINSRSKGARAERNLAKKFGKWWGSDFARTPSSGGFRTRKFREDWNAAGDLVTPDESFPFCVESKHAEGWTLEQLLTAESCLLYQWWDQTIGETPEGQTPLLVFRKNRFPHLFIMPLSAWQRVSSKNSLLTDFPQFEFNEQLVKLGRLEELFSTHPDDWK